MKRWLGLVLIVFCLMTLFQGQSVAKLDLERDKPIAAKVLQVVDGDTFELALLNDASPNVRLYKLIGVNTQGNAKAYEYSMKTLLGQIVYLLHDSKITPKNGVFFCYLYDSFDFSYNEMLLKKGYAVVDNNFLGASEYLKLLQNENTAKKNGLGIYNFSHLKPASKIINVNTASAEQFANHFGVDVYRASKWVAHIDGNPINEMGELRAVDKDFFTEEVILDYGPSIHLKTNLQTALAYEINTLSGKIIADQKITDIILDFRAFRDKIKAEDFDKIPIAESYRRKIKPFITYQEDYFVYYNDEKVINILSASEEQMEYALGVTKGQAVLLKNFITTNSYPLRSVEELFKPHFPLRQQQANMVRISDKIHFVTNINRASEYELRSLFGRSGVSSGIQLDVLKKILTKRPFKNLTDLEKEIGKTHTSYLKPYIAFDDTVKSGFLNLNTSGKETIMKELALPEKYKNQFPKQVLSPSDIPSFLLMHKDRITLYTNLNTADEKELRLLHPRMTEELAKEIVARRLAARFYELEDAGQVFKDHHLYDVFMEIKQYLVLQ